jgi:hypothetical protein
MTQPIVTHVIDPTVKTWTEDWTNADAWAAYGFLTANIQTNPTIGRYYVGGGSPQKKWDRNKPITARLRLMNTDANWIGFSFFSGESEYCGFSIQDGVVSYYNNAQYYTAANPFTASYETAIELQMEFDGGQTFSFYARHYDPSDTAAWTYIGTKTFQLTVHPSLQINQEWSGGEAYFGRIDVTGSEVWAMSDVADIRHYLPVHSNISYEWGIEYNNAVSDKGLVHYLPLAGGLTLAPTSGAAASWIQGVASTNYPAGAFSAQSAKITPFAGFGHFKLELIGALRGGGAGSYLRVYVRDSLSGVLIPDAQLGATNPIAFTDAVAVQKTVSLSGVVASSIYLEIEGYAPNATAKNWPDATGTTGPPVLKLASVEMGIAAEPTVARKKITGKKIGGKKFSRG